MSYLLQACQWVIPIRMDCRFDETGDGRREKTLETNAMGIFSQIILQNVSAGVSQLSGQVLGLLRR